MHTSGKATARAFTWAVTSTAFMPIQTHQVPKAAIGNGLYPRHKQAGASCLCPSSCFQFEKQKQSSRLGLKSGVGTRGEWKGEKNCLGDTLEERQQQGMAPLIPVPIGHFTPTEDGSRSFLKDPPTGSILFMPFIHTGAK